MVAENAVTDGQTEPLLITCSLGFQAITSEHGTFNENHHFQNEVCVALNQLVSLFYLFVARGGRKRGNRRTDRRTDGQQTDTLSTVTLAAHARRGLITCRRHEVREC